MAGDRRKLAAALADRGTFPLLAIDGNVVVTIPSTLNALVEALASMTALAAVPSSNAGHWPQCPAGSPDRDAPRAEVRAFARTCLAGRLAPRMGDDVTGAGCTAIAPSLLPELIERLTERPGADQPVRSTVDALVAAHRGAVAFVPTVYVHATDGVPQVSACLIMKDEAGDLAECLASLRPIADEIVIYDTGSTDGSVELARSLGAVVIEGEWRNDFAWARNQALAAARGTWVLSIDPDERLELERGVIGEVRGLLGDDPPVDRFIIDLYDLQGSVHAPVRSASAVPMARLFRRRRCHWVGALHEQPDARPGQPPARSVRLPSVNFLHHGYLDEIVRDKHKWDRNLAVAAAGVDKLPGTGKECFDLGRSLRSVGEHDRALALFERAADLDDNVVITRAALEFLVLGLGETGRSELTEPYLERLEQLQDGVGPARYLRGWMRVHQARWQEAVDCLDGVTGYDDHFTGFRVESLPLGLAIAYRGLGRRAEAAEAAVRTLQANDQAIEAWAVLFDCSDAGGPHDRAAAALVPPDHLVPLFAQLRSFPPSARDRLAEAVWWARPDDRVVLAVASKLAPELDDARALVWSERLRRNGLAALCPLHTLAEDGNRTVAERAALVAQGVHRFEADDLEPTLERLAGLLHDDELTALLDRCIAELGGAAGAVIVGGATTAARCLLVVGRLQGAGFTDGALAVLAHAADLDPGETRRLLDARPELRAELAEAAGTAGRGDLGAVLPDAA